MQVLQQPVDCQSGAPAIVTGQSHAMQRLGTGHGSEGKGAPGCGALQQVAVPSRRVAQNEIDQATL